MPTFKPVQNTPLPEAIAEQIMLMIADGQLKPGDRLPTEAQLMKQFDVGRSTLREALKSLAMAGLIETRRRSGAYISADYSSFLGDRLKWAVLLSEREVRHIVEVRYALEGQTAALAAERATADEKEKLAQLFAAIVEAQDPDQATDYDTAFHIAIAEASHNPLLLNLVLSFRKLIHDYIRLGYVKAGFDGKVDSEENIAQHRPILEAIQAGRPDEARQAMLDHLGYSAKLMLALAQERPHPAAEVKES
jgi:GntR family transcriptional regulator, transcriptional repressor for pyruvate dehydrogenase complex